MFRNKRRQLLGLGAASVTTLVAATLPTSSSYAQGVLDRLLRDKKVRIGWSNYPPLQTRDLRTRELSGYMVDAIRYIFAEVGIVPEFMEVTFGTLVASIDAGDVDMSIANTLITVKRAAAVDFTRPIGFLGSMMVVRADETRFNAMEDLNKPGIRISSLLGGAGQDFIRRHLPNATPLALNTSDKSAAFAAVSAGQADAGMNDTLAARRYVEAQPGVKELFDAPFDLHPTAWIVKKGNTDLLTFLNSSLDLLLLNGQYRQMAKMYPAVGEVAVETKLVPFP